MDEELRKEIIDYFDASELVELLGITTQQIVEEFSDEVEDAQDDLADIMQVKRMNGDESDS